MDLDIAFDLYMDEAVEAGVTPEQAVADWIGQALGSFVDDQGIEATSELLGAFRQSLVDVMDA